MYFIRLISLWYINSVSILAAECVFKIYLRRHIRRRIETPLGMNKDSNKFSVFNANESRFTKLVYRFKCYFFSLLLFAFFFSSKCSFVLNVE